jgi:hypothetical protein
MLCAKSLIREIPREYLGVRNALDQNLTSKHFNFEDVEDYYAEHTAVLSNPYKIKEDVNRVIDDMIKYVIFEYSVKVGPRDSISSPEEFFAEYFSRQYIRMLQSGNIAAIKVADGHSISGIRCMHPVGFTYGDVSTRAYYVENNPSMTYCVPTIHLNNPERIFIIEHNLLIVRCGSIEPSSNLRKNVHIYYADCEKVTSRNIKIAKRKSH